MVTPIQRAQETLHKKLCEWADDIEKDPAMREVLERDGGILFIVILAAMVAALVTKVMAPHSKVLLKPNGVEIFITVITDEFKKMLRKELKEYLRLKSRH